jgi:hypothetical protein|nr:hypothetical protein [Corynebacterium durum]
MQNRQIRFPPAKTFIFTTFFMQQIHLFKLLQMPDYCAGRNARLVGQEIYPGSSSTIIISFISKRDQQKLWARR